MKTYSDVLKSIKDAPTASMRLTSLGLGDTINIVINEDKVAVVGKTNRIPNASDRLLAGIRVGTNSADLKACKTTAEAREKGVVTTLQQAVVAETIKSIDEKTTFTVVHRLQIHDNVEDKPVYNNECYNGYGAYLKEMRRLRRLENEQDRNDGYQKASEDLRASGFNKARFDAADVKNIQHLPVFEVK
jgi:hypothetical protein